MNEQIIEKFWTAALQVGGISAIGAFVFWSLYKNIFGIISKLGVKMIPIQIFGILVIIPFFIFLALLVIVIPDIGNHLITLFILVGFLSLLITAAYFLTIRKPPIKVFRIGISSSIDISSDEPLAVFEKLSKIRGLSYPPFWYNCKEDNDKRFRVDVKGTEDSWLIPQIHVKWEKIASAEREELLDRSDANKLLSYQKVFLLLQDMKTFDNEVEISWHKATQGKYPLRRKLEVSGEKGCFFFCF